MLSLQDQLADIDAKIKSNQAQAQALRSQASEWENQSKTACKQLSKSKKSECEADKAMKAQKAQGMYANAVQLENTSELLKTKEGIQKLIVAEAESQVKLAEQGKDSNSLRILAEGTARAELLTAQNLSTAQAENVLRTAENEAASAKTKKTIFIIIGVVVVGAIGILIVKKIRKKNGKSKSKR